MNMKREINETDTLSVEPDAPERSASPFGPSSG